jgi:UDP-N-acetylmuramoyl-tripeptide--D-alanyl-D-alanine ligase
MHISELYKIWIQSGYQICTDSRNIKSGALFFALRGDRFNGNEFAKQALQSGAMAAVVDDPELKTYKGCIGVDDVLNTLQHLAIHHRNQMPAKVIALTGSNGKTTNKELIREVLLKKYKVLATVGNLNNHIGVPLTLLEIRPEHEFAIIEMGANHQGEIAQLSKIAAPDYGIITNIGKAHLEGFGGIEGVLKGKTELYRFLKTKNALVFVNADDAQLMQQSIDLKRITYGVSELANVQMTAAVSYNTECSISLIQPEHVELKSNLIGTYNAYNLLAAASVGIYFDVPIQDIAAALASYKPELNRSQQFKTAHNTLILDAYNANPSSMQAALNHIFNTCEGKHLVLILGDMYELGKASHTEHQNLVNQLLSHNCHAVYLIGSNFNKTTNHAFNTFETLNAFENYLNRHPIRGKVILLKGSRAMQLERLKPLL